MIKTIRMPIHPLTDIPEPSSDIAVTYKFLTGMKCYLLLYHNIPNHIVERGQSIMSRGVPCGRAYSCDCEPEEQRCCCVQYYQLHGFSEQHGRFLRLSSERMSFYNILSYIVH